MQFEFFDPAEDVFIHYRRLPHWEQAGATCFVTYRTIDSIPTDVLRRWRVERAQWMRRRNIDPFAADWRNDMRLLPRAERLDYHRRFTSPWMERLDQCHGECLLKRSEVSAIVAENLQHFDGSRYILGDFVIMPNHVHLLVQFEQPGRLKVQCRQWKRYSAGRINALLGRQGRFWQVESFDHLVRSPEQFEYLRGYIARNPTAAGLAPGEYRYYRRPDG